MASLDGISFDVTTRQVTRTILSSVGGFSQSARQHIRSLQDLLSTIQRFDLDVFDSRSLRRDGFIGEGVSYRVTKCVHSRTNKLYAVKTVKLPQRGADSGAFERQVACVLRDIEVMYGLAKRPNILDIYGYGWDVDSGNVIPFLVTEFAAEGTLRHFLKNNELSIHEKLLLCKDVAQGLHFLHVSGIAHGDLKLDNVLVTPYVGMGFSHVEQDFLRTMGMEACISDFGHSLHLYDDEGDSVVKQRYGGTLAYNAPEILDKYRTTRSDVNFRKCDIWSLGLSLWEILIDGKAYYHNADVEDSIMSSQKRTNSLPTPPPSNAPSQGSSAALVEELATIAPQLAGIACKEVSDKTQDKLTAREISRLHFLFQRCLDHNVKTRLADIPLLPFFHGQKADTASGAAPSRIQQVGAASTSWSFELFRVADTIPDEVKKQIANDCQKIANEPGGSILTARASFQLGFAYATGFGVPQDIAEALHWFEQAGDKGLRFAELYLPVLRNLKMDPSVEHAECLENYLAGTRRAFLLKFASTLLDLEDSSTASEEVIRDALSVDKYIKDYQTSPNADVDALDKDGNTPLTLVSKFGVSATTQWLLSRGASATLPDNQGYSALHYLWMYPPEDIRRIASQLTNERNGFLFAGQIQDKIHVPSALNLVGGVSRVNLDPQLPLLLWGTPLAFAVAVHCKPAVEALLALGADPLLGVPVAGQEVQSGSAIAVAYCLHTADILELLLEFLVKHGLPSPVLSRLLTGLQSILPASHMERALLHGSHIETAAEETIAVLLDYHRYAGHDPRPWELLKPAATNPNLVLCKSIVNIMVRNTGASLNPEASLSTEELDELMRICIVTGCQSGRNLAQAIEMLEFAIGIGANINYHKPVVAVKDSVPLFYVIDRHHGDLLDWILEHTDVNLSVKDDFGETALHRMIRSGFSSSYDIEKLIRKCAPNVDAEEMVSVEDIVNVKNIEGDTPIALIKSDKQVDEYKALLRFVPHEGRSYLLDNAIKADAPKLVTAHLTDLDASTRKSLFNLNGGLSLAAEVASGEVAEILISYGANADKETSSGYATIHEAASYGNIDVLNMCLKRGHDVNKESGQGTPLLLATLKLIENDQMSTGARTCVDALLEAGANPSCMDSDTRTPLAFLLEAPKHVRTKHTALIRKLLEKGADPNEGKKSPLLEYSLAKAIREEDWDLADLLVKHNIDLDRTGKDGGYPLHSCAKMPEAIGVAQTEESRPAQLAMQLMARGADALKKDKEDFTALERAVWNHNAPVTLRIVEHIMASAGIKHGKLPVSIPQDPSIKKGRRLFRNLLRDKNKSSSHNTVHIQPREIPELQEGWGLAVFYKSFTCMTAFIRAGAQGPFNYLTRRVALSLLGHALVNELEDVMIKFMGGSTEDGFEKPDEYLKSVWDSVRDYFPWSRDPELLQDYGYLTTNNYITSSGLAVAHVDLDETKFEEKIAADEDMPAFFNYWYFRLQYMSAINEYTRALPASHLVARGYVEAQDESDLKDVILDEEAERKRKEYAALQSILVPGDAGDEFTHDSGF